MMKEATQTRGSTIYLTEPEEVTQDFTESVFSEADLTTNDYWEEPVECKEKIWRFIAIVAMSLLALVDFSIVTFAILSRLRAKKLKNHAPFPNDKICIVLSSKRDKLYIDLCKK